MTDRSLVSRPGRHGRGPIARQGALPVFAALMALAVAAPVIALLFTSLGVAEGVGTLSHLVQTVLPGYVLTTAGLAIMVLAVSLSVGVGSAWLVASYDFPGRAFLAVLLVLPLAMPAYVMAYAYTDFLETTGPLQSALRAFTGWQVREYWFPDFRSTWGAGLFLGLALFPYVYLLSRAAFAERPVSLDEAARSLGQRPIGLWWRVVLPVARPAIVAGSALVLMETLADFGVVNYFAVDSFTAGIYRSWLSLGDRTGAARLAIVLLAFIALLALIERRQRGRMSFVQRAGRHPVRRRLAGAGALGAVCACAAPALLGFVLPAGLLIWRWLGDGAAVDPRLPQWLWNTVSLALLGALATMTVGLLAAYAVRQAAGRGTRLAVALALGGYALPGIVLGIGLLQVAGSVDRWLWQPLAGQALMSGTVVALVWAYAVRFFAVAYQGLDAGLARIARSMDDSARSLGRGPLAVLLEVHWPLLRRSLALTGLLVMIECLKELPATLVLRPFDTDTLAVVAFQFASDERLTQSALPSLMIVMVGVLPVLALGRAALRE
ncbi:MAG: iron ABC transporter permease [Burkholderiaceae bacterium]